MGFIQWEHRPSLKDPVLVAGFSGWNDAGDAASSTIRYLIEHCEAELFARVDPEELYDFTSTRPSIHSGKDGHRTITWSTVELYSGTLPDGADAIFAVGPEPHLRWRTFCKDLLEALGELGGSRTVVLGALVAEVPHSRPVQIVGAADTSERSDELDLQPSTYEGPTGIVGVLTAASRDAGLATTSLWATVPPYVPSAPSPKATLALVEQTAQALDIWIPTTDLEVAAAAYESQVSELVAEDEETSNYVEELERRHDADSEQPGRALVEEVERFLRDRGS